MGTGKATYLFCNLCCHIHDSLSFQAQYSSRMVHIHADDSLVPSEMGADGPVLVEQGYNG